MDYRQLTIEIFELSKKVDSTSDEECKYKSKLLWKHKAGGKYLREQRIKYLKLKRDKLSEGLPLVGMTEATSKIDMSNRKTYKIPLDGGKSKPSTTKYIWDIIKELSIKYPKSKFINDAVLLYYPDSMFTYDVDYSSQYLRNYIIDASIESEIDYSMKLFNKKHIETLTINEDKWLNKEYVLTNRDITRLK